jgi:hypothetical protein
MRFGGGLVDALYVLGNLRRVLGNLVAARAAVLAARSEENNAPGPAPGNSCEQHEMGAKIQIEIVSGIVERKAVAGPGHGIDNQIVLRDEFRKLWATFDALLDEVCTERNIFPFSSGSREQSVDDGDFRAGRLKRQRRPAADETRTSENEDSDAHLSSFKCPKCSLYASCAAW